MLYLPPGWGHDGTAVGACLTASIGFRAPLAGDARAPTCCSVSPKRQRATTTRRRACGAAIATRGEAASDRPARIPASLQRFAADAVERLAGDRAACARALGEALSEPKPGTWFERREQAPALPAAIVLDRKTRMLYDERHVFINGESFRAAGRDATLVRRLADRRRLDARSVARMSDEAGRTAGGMAARRLVRRRRRAARRGPDMTDDTTTAIASRADFLAAVRAAFVAGRGSATPPRS